MSNLKDIVEANESFKRNREGLHPDIIGFSEELLSYFPNAVFTSGKRPGAVTNFGKPSRHSKGEAVDLRITPEIGEFLSNNRKGIELLHKYQLGFLDESKAENKKWGNALHIGKDTTLVEKTNTKWKEWQNKQEDTAPNYVSNGVIHFQKKPSMVGVNLGELVPEEDKTKEQKEIEESNKALELEDRKLKLFEQFNKKQTPQQEEEVIQQTVQTPDFNALEAYQQIDQFVSNPLMQAGGVVSTDDWLKNWYSNRVIQDPYIQQGYLEDKGIIMNRLNTPPDVKMVDSIDGNVNTTGRYENNKIYLTDYAQESTYLHERNHHVNDFPSVMRTIHQDVVRNNIYKKGDERLGQTNNKYYDYLSDPDEIHSRIQVLRRDAGFKPKETIKKEQLLKYLQNYEGDDNNILEVINMTDLDGLLNLLNSMAVKDNINNEYTYAQQGGQIPTSSLGQYQYPNQVVNVPTDGRITMQGVDYPLLGISQETGQRQVMYPGLEYLFQNTKNVLEIPLI